jgi:antitoxin MazE
MRARLVKIGNSRGLRLAKPLLQQAGLSDEVDIQVAPGLLTIRPVTRPRAGWAEAAAAAAAAAAAEVPPEGLLEAPSATRFDDDEWQW